MRSKLRKNIGTGIVVFLITVWFIPSLAGAFAPGQGRRDMNFAKRPHRRSPLGIWRNPQMVQELGLTSEQVKQVRDADFDFREKRLALKAQLKGLRLQMDKAFSEDSVNDTAVLKLAEKMSDVKGKLFVQRVESRLSLVKILNADQIQKLRNMRLERKGRKDGRNHPYGHGAAGKSGTRACLED